MKKISDEKMNKVEEIKYALGKEYSAFVHNAVEEILHNVFNVAKTEKQHDKIIDDIGTYIKNKLEVSSDDNIEWENIEKWYYEWSLSLLNFIDEKEAVKILGSIELKNPHRWEEPYGKIDVEYLQSEIYKSIIKNIDMRTIEELNKEFKC
ncbi:hypothetical protein [Poseidonibacter ostreae]|uniref:Uncharacterized protein n=1 Tax=Poseidonibacter ostreae TaxID=2654171 RepID=A0A6L4WZN1_9BACT|nr:hypothetical protein [Poseidonibacter ostreae]KAB7891444.1 hypothetical protein GBG19_00985 [Poseidonibacter ostreae]